MKKIIITIIIILSSFLCEAQQDSILLDTIYIQRVTFIKKLPNTIKYMAETIIKFYVCCNIIVYIERKL